MKYKGLSAPEAKNLLKKYGPNEIRDTQKNSIVKIFIRQIKNNFIVYLLFVSMAISFFVGKNITAYTILGVITMVILTGFIQEYKAEKAILYLKKMVTHVSVVIRDGEEKEIESSAIVPGDILIARTGEKVPADCNILEQNEMFVNEAILTGEAKEVKKQALVSAQTEAIDENMLFAGTFITGGKCVAEVLHTGMNTRFGKIAKLISGAEKELPLQIKVNKISKYMAIIGASVAIMTGLGILVTGEISRDLIIEVLILTIAISVSAFPEGFPVVLMTTLSSGAYRMAKKNAIVNRMSIIETLGETTVICTDKTGTITRGEMTVKKIFCNGKNYDVGGVGYENEGNFTLKGIKVDPEKERTLRLFLKAAVLCNDAFIKKAEAGNIYQISGMPTEAALLVMSGKADIFKEDFSVERKEELTFNSERKLMSVLVSEGDNFFVYAKGAPEVLLKKCQRQEKASGIVKLSKKAKEKILFESDELTAKSYRTIAIAYKDGKGVGKGDLEDNLIFLGLAGIEDPPRLEVKSSVAICKKAGIKVKMITGDNRETAMSIAKQIELGEGRSILGEELDDLSDEELSKIVNDINVFARVRPEHKIRIVKALKSNGEIVTMTGDGVNDAPALKEAHIGVAMGKNGTDVSRSVSDLILKDDNFATIVLAIKEGRTIFNNIKKFASYQLSCNAAELCVLFVGVLLSPVLGWPTPVLLALHILFMNMVTDNIPAITLGFNGSSLDIMEDPPRKKAQIITKETLIVLAFSGLIMSVLTLLTFWFTYNVLGYSLVGARTTTLVALIVLEIANAYNFRSFRKSVLRRSLFVNKYLVYATFVSLAATCAIVYTPLNKIFETEPLSYSGWLTALGMGILIIVIFDFAKMLNKKKKFLSFE